MSFLIHAQNQLCVLSDLLQLDKIKIKFDYLKNLDNLEVIPVNLNKSDLFLALYVGDINISTIQCTFKKKFMYISSKTHENYLNKKYNLLLRCIIILILPVHTKIRSFAINEYSEICLKKYFNVTPVKNESCTFELKVSDNTACATDTFNKLINHYHK